MDYAEAAEVPDDLSDGDSISQGSETAVVRLNTIDTKAVPT